MIEALTQLYHHAMLYLHHSDEGSLASAMCHFGYLNMGVMQDFAEAVLRWEIGC